eukprot:gb/GECH01000411.1/.p1 GENE.gb/GECH01000411.1/~~gb/GECH01000411.1/.p1  ORF type:complete len:525 (+),score=95.37 gb/GECH01000411.1/:1-1575(+)
MRIVSTVPNSFINNKNVNINISKDTCSCFHREVKLNRFSSLRKNISSSSSSTSSSSLTSTTLPSSTKAKEKKNPITSSLEQCLLSSDVEKAKRIMQQYLGNATHNTADSRSSEIPSQVRNMFFDVLIAADDISSVVRLNRYATIRPTNRSPHLLYALLRGHIQQREYHNAARIGMEMAKRGFMDTETVVLTMEAMLKTRQAAAAWKVFQAAKSADVPLTSGLYSSVLSVLIDSRVMFSEVESVLKEISDNHTSLTVSLATRVMEHYRQLFWYSSGVNVSHSDHEDMKEEYRQQIWFTYQKALASHRAYPQEGIIPLLQTALRIAAEHGDFDQAKLVLKQIDHYLSRQFSIGDKELRTVLRAARNAGYEERRLRSIYDRLYSQYNATPSTTTLNLMLSAALDSAKHRPTQLWTERLSSKSKLRFVDMETLVRAYILLGQLEQAVAMFRNIPYENSNLALKLNAALKSNDSPHLQKLAKELHLSKRKDKRKHKTRSDYEQQVSQPSATDQNFKWLDVLQAGRHNAN